MMECSCMGFFRISRGFVLLVLILGGIVSQGAFGIRVNKTQQKQNAFVSVSVEAAAAAAPPSNSKPAVDLNFQNVKRRVPAGSDPIHNRRAGKSGEPPAV